MYNILDCYTSSSSALVVTRAQKIWNAPPPCLLLLFLPPSLLIKLSGSRSKCTSMQHYALCHCQVVRCGLGVSFLHNILCFCIWAFLPSVLQIYFDGVSDAVSQLHAIPCLWKIKWKILDIFWAADTVDMIYTMLPEHSLCIKMDGVFGLRYNSVSVGPISSSKPTQLLLDKEYIEN